MSRAIERGMRSVKIDTVIIQEYRFINFLELSFFQAERKKSFMSLNIASHLLFIIYNILYYDVVRRSRAFLLYFAFKAIALSVFVRE